MAQLSSHEQLSIQEVPNILKISRQNAALGLYPDAIRSFRHALHVISEHIKTLQDPFLKEQWKKADEEVKGEVEIIYKLYKALKGLRGEPGSSSKGSSSTGVTSPEERPLPKHAAPSQPLEQRAPKPPPSVLERFGSQPFVKKEEQAGVFAQKEVKREDPPVLYHYPSGPVVPSEPKKDPMVWDPPSPKYQEKKAAQAKKLPKWAQPKAGAVSGKHVKAPMYGLKKCD